ncbi:MAG: hypothetical protein KF760_18395 [Candidatus Eremiobacteraeota bacterium]|nr:hypothetical protein [Candidatus Eremiobacteraeota bacterium]MCW5869371.1 hypothetical protein [Candidatus Eremiobacteraeota bacterium]
MKPGKLILVLGFLVTSMSAFAQDLSVENVKLGMTSRQVVGKLGKEYSMVDLIRESVGEGEDYSLLFRKGSPQEIDVTFTFGKVSSIEGFRLNYDGKSVAAGELSKKIIALLGPPQEKDKSGLEYAVRSLHARLVFRLKQDRLKSIVLEQW